MPTSSAEQQMLEAIQRQAFQYFVHETNPGNGLVLDKTADDWPASIAATGLGLSSYPVGVTRGWMSRADAAARTLTTLRFFHGSAQGPEPDATGYRGFYYHFLRMDTGTRAWHSELSTVDSALLIAGMLVAGVFFDADDAAEQEIRELSQQLYERVDWQWAQNGGDTVTHGWHPESGFLPYRWQGYDEALILYLLGLGSPSHPLAPASYAAWASTYEWKQVYDTSFLYAGPLFTHQLSHVWVDFRGIADQFMRDHGLDYFENSRRATLVQQEYARRNPGDFAHYGEFCWGFTASDGPGDITCSARGVERQFFDYRARAVPYGPDDGTIAPWAALTSLPFAPDIVLPTVAHFNELHLNDAHPYGFKATFNPTFPDGDPINGWVSPWHFGINEGPIVIMTENYLSGLIWQLMRRCTPLIAGLRAAGFTGGWLAEGGTAATHAG